jgi:hypothetical protein
MPRSASRRCLAPSSRAGRWLFPLLVLGAIDTEALLEAGPPLMCLLRCCGGAWYLGLFPPLTSHCPGSQPLIQVCIQMSCTAIQQQKNHLHPPNTALHKTALDNRPQQKEWAPYPEQGLGEARGSFPPQAWWEPEWFWVPLSTHSRLGSWVFRSFVCFPALWTWAEASMEFP